MTQTFLIFGTPTCGFCSDAKQLLNENSLRYVYYDLTLKYGESWRDVFGFLGNTFDLVKPNRIPIIFQAKGDPVEGFTFPDTAEELQQHWTYVGGFFELEELVEDMDVELSETY